MKARLVLSILLLVFIGVAAYLLTLDQAGEEAIEVARLSKVDVDSINTIKILRKNADTLYFVKQNGEWRMQSPQRFRAKPSRIDAILGILNSRSFYQIDAKQADLRLFQLAPPQIGLQLNQLRFDFGATEPIDERRYVMTGDRIHLINDSLYHQLNQSSSFYASDRLIAGNERIASINFRALPSVEREEDSSDNLSELQLAWQNAQARKVSVYQRSPDYAGATVKVKLTSGHTVIFDVVSNSPLLVLGRADIGLQYSFSKEQGDELLPVKK